MLMMRAFFLSAGLFGLAVSAACASAQAKAPVERPNLEMPEPPPRVIEPGLHELVPPEPVSELPPAPPAPRPRPQAATREPAKPDPKPEAPVEPAASVATGPVAPLPAAPILRTPATADSEGVTRQIRDILDRAKKALDSIDYRPLTKDRRTQYDSAKLMISNSEEALKTSNIEYARTLADRAERIVKELQIR